MKKLALALILISLSLMPIPKVKAHRCVEVLQQELHDNCITTRRTICCDGPNSCVVETSTECY